MALAKQPSCIGEFISGSYLVLTCFSDFCFNFNVYCRVYFRLQVGEVVTTIPSRSLVLILKYFSIQSSI